MYITIRTKGIDLTPELKEFVDEKIGTLDKFHPAIMDGAVELEKMAPGHHKTGPFFRAEVSLRLAYNKVIRSENSESDIRMAINSVKDELQQEIKSFKETQAAKEKRGGRAGKKLSALAPEALRPSEEDKGGRNLSEGV